ncbi:MAG: 2-oxo acid dehydrogenase subunit E2 [Cyanobacteria bacterium J06649_4]
MFISPTQTTLQATDANSVHEIAWPVLRNNVSDFLTQAKQVPQISATWEIDITKAHERIRQIQRQTRTAISFNAYLIFLISRSIQKYPEVQTIRVPWQRKMALYDGVDINTIVEQRLPDNTTFPAPYVVRNAESKSLAEICLEMRQASKRDLTNNEVNAKVRFGRERLAQLPGWLRRLFWAWVDANPARRRQVRGTFGLTNLNFLSHGLTAGFGHFLSNMSSSICIGSSYDRLVPNDKDPRGFVVRRHLCCTLAANHLVIDGAPLTRFAKTLTSALEAAEGLDEQFADDLIAQYKQVQSS